MRPAAVLCVYLVLARERRVAQRRGDGDAPVTLAHDLARLLALSLHPLQLPVERRVVRAEALVRKIVTVDDAVANLLRRHQQLVVEAAEALERVQLPALGKAQVLFALAKRVGVVEVALRHDNFSCVEVVRQVAFEAGNVGQLVAAVFAGSHAVADRRQAAVAAVGALKKLQVLLGVAAAAPAAVRAVADDADVVDRDGRRQVLGPAVQARVVADLPALHPVVAAVGQLQAGHAPEVLALEDPLEAGGFPVLADHRAAQTLVGRVAAVQPAVLHLVPRDVLVALRLDVARVLVQKALAFDGVLVRFTPAQFSRAFLRFRVRIGVLFCVFFV